MPLPVPANSVRFSFTCRGFRWLCPLFWCAFSVGCASTASYAQDIPPGPRSVWNIAQRGAFVMSSLYDGKRFYWFGTEDKGVWRYDPHAPSKSAWRNFTTKDGLGDDNGYALATDHQGRVWVGHQSHGVSVWSGRAWHNYDVTEGPLGERVSDIAVSPVDGSVWIATNRGISIYNPEEDTWRYENRMTGLPSDQIQALSFTKDGTVLVGTQCDGLAIGELKDDYAHWDVAKGPGYMPLYATGPGLPSDLINDVFVGSDDTVYVATGYGLARSSDKGENWTYLRGADWRDKLNGQTFPPTIPQQPKREMLLEDYVTTIAEDSQGHIWLGHPTKGVEVRSAGADFLGGGGVVQTPDAVKQQQREKTFEEEVRKAQEAQEAADDQNDGGQQNGDDGNPDGDGTAGAIPEVHLPKLAQDEKTDYVTSILPVTGEAPLVCGAGSGVVQLGGQLASQPVENDQDDGEAMGIAALPSPAVIPTTEQLESITQQVEALKTLTVRPAAAVLDDDWKTQGDWMGRYGTRYALLCAMRSPLDQSVVNDPDYAVQSRLGVHPYKDGKSFEEQGVRHWVHRERWDDQRVLYNPHLGYRRQADIDDNGEAYSMNYEGPDLWVGVRVPAGTQRVSLYFFNKDGHDANNRVRDYVIDVKRGHQNVLVSDGYPTLARARVHDFWGGVYKTFELQGPGDYYFVVRKNNSFNTILQAVLIDKLAGPESSNDTRRDVWLGDVRYEAPSEQRRTILEAAALTAASPAEKEQVAAALDLWETLEGAYDKDGNEVFQGAGHLLAYRTLQQSVGNLPQGQALLAAWRWRLPLWPEADRGGFDDAMKKGWNSLAQNNPTLFAKAN